MDNIEAARTLFGVAALLESQGANPYRVRAYRRAARGLMRLSREPRGVAVEGGEGRFSWLGPRLLKKLGELVTHGRMQFHDELLEQLPSGLRELLEVPGIGPKTADLLMRELKVRSVGGVIRAAQRGKFSALRGIGVVREQQLATAARDLLASRAAGTSVAIATATSA